MNQRSSDQLPVDLGPAIAASIFWWRLVGFVVNFAGCVLLYSAVLVALQLPWKTQMFYSGFVALMWTVGLGMYGFFTGAWLSEHERELPGEVTVALFVVAIPYALVMAIPVLLIANQVV